MSYFDQFEPEEGAENACAPCEDCELIQQQVLRVAGEIRTAIDKGEFEKEANLRVTRDFLLSRQEKHAREHRMTKEEIEHERNKKKRTKASRNGN